MLIKRFISDEEGNVALEAIWSVLTLAVFLLPTVMLFEIMDTQLDNNIGVRSAARNEAINSNCNGNFFIPLPGGGNSTNTSTSVLGCLKSNKTNDYWKKMQSVANGHYNGLADSFQSEGETNLIRSNVALHMTTAQDPGAIISGFNYFQATEFKVPSTETWQFNNNVWAEGHDQAIWNKLPRTPRDRLFSKVFPSAN